jgi:hypothetical protein
MKEKGRRELRASKRDATYHTYGGVKIQEAGGYMQVLEANGTQ